MDMIERLESQKDHKGKSRRWGKFYCPYCKRIVKKRIGDGQKIKSCGCAKGKLSGSFHTKHGHSKRGKITRLYRIFNGMRQRCGNKNSAIFEHYGGRGITVCNEWKNDFIAFKNWAVQNGYQDHLQLDRKNNNLGYSPNNCRFVTSAINNRNKRTTKLNNEKVNEIRIIYKDGKHFQYEIAKMYGITQTHVSQIIKMKQWV